MATSRGEKYNLDTLSKDCIRLYFNYLSGLARDEGYYLLDSDTEAMIELLRHSLCKIFGLKSKNSYPEIEYLVPLCAKRLRHDLPYILSVKPKDKNKFFQLCVLYIVKSRDRVIGKESLDPEEYLLKTS